MSNTPAHDAYLEMKQRAETAERRLAHSEEHRTHGRRKSSGQRVEIKRLDTALKEALCELGETKDQMLADKSVDDLLHRNSLLVAQFNREAKHGKIARSRYGIGKVALQSVKAERDEEKQAAASALELCDEYLRQVDEVTAQRDAALEACQAFIDAWQEPDGGLDKAYIKCRALLAP